MTEKFPWIPGWERWARALDEVRRNIAEGVGESRPASAAAASPPRKTNLINRAVVLEAEKFSDRGRTTPLLCRVQMENGHEFHAFVKLSACCDLGVVNLAREAMAACLAKDLGLPLAKPLIVEIPDDVGKVTINPEIASFLTASSRVAFGSTRVTKVRVWNEGEHRIQTGVRTAAAILLFDAIIQNSDRRVGNPNCLADKRRLHIFDHEMAFDLGDPYFWIPPWVPGGMSGMDFKSNPHVFVPMLKGAHIDWEPIKSRWAGLTDARLKQYMDEMPDEWNGPVRTWEPRKG